MKATLAFLTVLFLSTMALANFQGYQSTTNLGLFSKLKCSTGLTCTKVGDKMNMVATTAGLLQSTESASTTSLTSSQCGSTIKNAGVIQVGLPLATSALVGCRFTFVTAAANSFHVNPGDKDMILVSTDASGDRVHNATLGNAITIQALAVSLWFPVSVQGTWSDQN